MKDLYEAKMGAAGVNVVTKDGHTMFSEDVVSDLNRLNRRSKKLELDIGLLDIAHDGKAALLASCETALSDRDKKILAIGAAIHYPDCWDTIAYPTLLDAICEFSCNPQCCTKITTLGH